MIHYARTSLKGETLCVRLCKTEREGEGGRRKGGRRREKEREIGRVLCTFKYIEETH